MEKRAPTELTRPHTLRLLALLGCLMAAPSAGEFPACTGVGEGRGAADLARVGESQSRATRKPLASPSPLHHRGSPEPWLSLALPGSSPPRGLKKLGGKLRRREGGPRLNEWGAPGAEMNRELKEQKGGPGVWRNPKTSREGGARLNVGMRGL